MQNKPAIKLEIHMSAFNNYQEVRRLLQSIGTTERGIEIMEDKMMFQVLKICNLDTRAANILKQSMLSQGGELAVSAGTVNLAVPYTDAVLMGTVHKIKNALPRLKEQPWGLKGLAEQLEEYLKGLKYS